MPLTADQRQALESLLERERSKLVRRLRRFGEEMDFSDGGFSQHMAEQAAAFTERETAFLKASEEGQRLIRVNQALDRLVHEPARFGTCRECAADIAFERLEVLPYAEHCIDCQRNEEQGGSRARE